MAKKNKDDIEDNDDLNEGRSEDINDADDNFGLPDVEYSPVNREESDEPTEEPTPDYKSEPVSKADYIASAEESSATTGYTRYSPPPRESNAPKIIILLVILLAVAAGLWYFGFYAPEQDRLKAEQEQQERTRQENEELARQAQADRERQEREEAQREAERLAAEAEAAKPTVGELETITNRTGRYYVIVASALDEDLAVDYAKKLNSQGTNIKILKPDGSNKFHRVAVGDFDSWAGAEQEANQLKSAYGEGVWVVKF